MLEAGTADTPPNLVRGAYSRKRTFWPEQYSTTFPRMLPRDTDQKSPTKMDPAWGAKLDELLARFMSLSTQLADTSAGSLFLTTGPIADLDKAVASIKEGDRNKVKRLLALRDQFGMGIPRAQVGAVRLNELKNKPAGTERSIMKAMYASLAHELNEMEKLAEELGAKPANTSESRQKKLTAEFRALMGEIEKTKTGAILLTIGPMADPAKATAGLKEADAKRVKRLLVIRERFDLLVPQGQKALDRWEKAKLEFRIKEPNYKSGAISGIRMGASQVGTQASRAHTANRGGRPGRPPRRPRKGCEGTRRGAASKADTLEAEYKKSMADYDSLALRLASTAVGRLLAPIHRRAVGRRARSSQLSVTMPKRSPRGIASCRFETKS